MYTTLQLSLMCVTLRLSPMYELHVCVCHINMYVYVTYMTLQLNPIYVYVTFVTHTAGGALHTCHRSTSCSYRTDDKEQLCSLFLTSDMLSFLLIIIMMLNVGLDGAGGQVDGVLK
jgi:hypothetical protein